MNKQFFEENQDFYFKPRFEDLQTVEHNQLVSNRQAVINNDTGDIVGVVSKNYNILSHKEAVESLIKVLDENDIKHQMLSPQGSPSHLFQRIQLPETRINFSEPAYDNRYGADVPDDVILEIEFENSYNGNSGAKISIIGKRLICLNGLRTAEKFAEWKYYHSEKIAAMLTELSEQIMLAINYFQTTVFENWKALQKEQYTHRLVFEIAKHINFGKQYLKKFKEFLRQHEKLQTKWDLFQAYTYFITHYIEQRSYTAARTYGKKLAKFMEGE